MNIQTLCAPGSVRARRPLAGLLGGVMLLIPFNLAGAKSWHALVPGNAK